MPVSGLTRSQTDQLYAHVTSLPVSNGTDDTAALQAVLDAGAGGIVVGVPGQTYITTDPLYAPANTTILMHGCTVRAKAGAAGHYMLRATGMKAAVLAPRSLAATPSTTGGTLAAATYTFQVTAITASGETCGCQYAAATTTGSTGSVALTWTASLSGPTAAAITGYKVYELSTAKLAATVSAATVSYTFTATGGTTATPPISNGTISRTAGITIRGGTWDANWQNVTVGSGNSWQSSYWVGHALDMQKVDGLRICDATVLNAYKWAVAVADFTDLVTENVNLNTRSDGIHILGPGDSWTCRGTRGVTGDDMHGVSLAEWPNQAVSAGSIGQVTITDTFGSGVPSFVRVLGAAGYTLGSLTIEKVRGTYTGAFTGGIYVSDDQPTGNVALNGTDINKLTIRDVNITTAGAGSAPPIYIGGRNLGQVLVEDVFHNDTTPVQTIYLYKGAASAATLQTIQDLTIRKITRVMSAAAQTVVGFSGAGTYVKATLDDISAIGGNYAAFAVSVGTCNINTLLIRRLRYTAAAATGSAVTIPSGGTTNIGRLIIDEAFVDAAFRLLDHAQTGAAVFSIIIRGGRFVSVSELIRILQSTGTVYVTLRDTRTEALANAGLVNAGTSSSVIVMGGGNFLPLAKVALYAGGAATLTRVNGIDLPVDLTLTALTPQDGDTARNTNAAVGTGIGAVVYNTAAVKWKGIYSGTTN